MKTGRPVDKYIGDLSQLAGIKHFEFKSGKAKGVEAFEVRTGAGLSYTVLKDRCLDIAWAEFKGIPLSYISNTGVVAPSFFEPQDLGYFRSFTVGLLSTCGLTYCGAPCQDRGENLGLHGRIGNIPAEETGYETVRENGELVFVIKGKIREAMFFRENLLLERRITSKFGDNKIHIHDKVINLGFEEQPFMIIYHINFGYPLLQENTELITPVNSVISRDSRAEEGIDRRHIIESPQAGFAEQVYYLDLAADTEGYTSVGVINKELGIGVYERFNKKQLPRFIQWKQMGEGYYVMGLEPANCLPEGRSAERERGTLQYIKPGETKEFDIEIGVLEDETEIEKFKRLT